MEPLFAVAGFVFGFLALQLGYHAGLQRGRAERATQPPVISFVPTTIKAPPAPWRSSVTPDALLVVAAALSVGGLRA